MHPITNPNHLLIPLLLAITGIIIVIILRGKMNRSVFVGVLTSLSLYATIVGTAFYDDIYYQWNLNQFDLNKDGVFSDAEITPEQELAYTRLINDTGRNLSFITGGIFAVMIGLVMYFSSKFLGRLTNMKKDTH